MRSRWVRAIGARVAFLTNNPLRRGDVYAAKLSALGIPCAADEVVTSLDALTGYLRDAPPGGPMLLVAEPLVGEVLLEAGHRLTDRPDEAAMVVVSWDRGFDYPKLLAAFRAVRNGARIVATNPDPYLSHRRWRAARLRRDAGRARGVHRCPCRGDRGQAVPAHGAGHPAPDRRPGARTR